MGLFGRRKKAEKQAEKRETLNIPFHWGDSQAIGTGNATAFLCEKIIADAVSSVPLVLYEQKRDRSRVKAGFHPLYYLAKYSPNADEPPGLFYATMVRDYFQGNVYLKKTYDGSAVSSLFLLDPNKTTVRREAGQKIFTHEGKTYTSAQILHIPQKWTYDGLKGYPLREILANVLAAGASLDEYAIESFKGFIGKRLVMEMMAEKIEGKTEEQLQRTQDIFAAKFGGPKNAGKALLQLPGTKYTVLDTGTVDDRVRWIKENALFQDERVAKVYGVPLPLINGTYQNNIEELFTVFIEMGIRPICTHFAQSFEMMLAPAERESMYFEPDYNGLNKTDLAARIEAYSKQLRTALLSINEAREKENLPGIGPLGDVRFVESNLMPLTKENIDAYMAKNKQALEGQGGGPK